MVKQVVMTARQKELLSLAYKAVEESREKRDLNVLLEGMATFLEGRLVSADTTAGCFNVEIPDAEAPLAEKPPE